MFITIKLYTLPSSPELWGLTSFATVDRESGVGIALLAAILLASALLVLCKWLEALWDTKIDEQCYVVTETV